MAEKMIVVLVHGWSVSNTSTYGELPQRLESEGMDSIDVRQIWLSKYVSFRDEVRLKDLAKGFEAALAEELGDEIKAKRKIACIAHSTGGPVIRDWWDRYYVQTGRPCPLSHFIMLAPANFGSALAQLGKGRLNHLRSAAKGIESGQRVLDWLELGSPESWDLNSRWIRDYPVPAAGEPPVFQFVLTGQWIDRKLYDHVNSYTGELGSDGTVRVAAANLNAAYVRLEQETPKWFETDATGHSRYKADKLEVTEYSQSPRTAFALISKRSHVGEKDGILYSIKDNGRRHPTVTAIRQCLSVESKADYDKLCDRFEQANVRIHERERLELYRRPILRDISYIHDRMSMVILRIRDDRGYPLDDFDFKFTGPQNNPDLLPEGFFEDRQRNLHDRCAITYFINCDKMLGTPEVVDPKSNYILRDAYPPLSSLGIQIIPRPRMGYVHYLTACLRARSDVLESVLKPDQTTLIDIVMRRCVREGVHRLTQETAPKDFHAQPYGTLINF